MSFDFRTITEIDMDKQKDLLDICKRILSQLPEALVQTSGKEDNRYYYYKRPSDLTFQIVHKGNAEEQKLYQNICLGKWLKKMIRFIERNLKAQSRMLKQYQSYEIEEIGEIMPLACKVVDVDFVKKAIRKNDPLPFPSQSECPYHLEELVHRTTFGLYMRSKSEVMIAELLWAAGIQFAYEPEIRLLGPDGKEHVYYPDFLVWDASGKVYYWEHIGLFTDLKYRRRNEQKLLVYFFNKITIGNNLIITSDDRDGALDLDTIFRYIGWLR